jgi:4-hydroxythreonine-4-phosphate dehydrogenase
VDRAGTRARRPLVVLSGGDPNGIGPEICLRAAGSAPVRGVCRPILVGDPSVFEYYRRKFRIGVTLTQADPGCLPAGGSAVPVITIPRTRAFRPSPGRPSRAAGLIAGRSLEMAVLLCRSGTADALVTGPLSKSTLNLAGFRFPGQTEMVARMSGAASPLMILVNGKFRVALVTAHIPLGRVAPALTPARVTDTLRGFHASLRGDFGIGRPEIAVLGLNPHAGESGLLGAEEEEIILPAIRSLRRKGLLVSGPFPADGFFGKRSETTFDGVVALYHDQGLIPLKMSGFSSVVNVTAGLPVVRTSPGHGTAFDIAGKGTADPSSMVAAVLAAVGICRNRGVSSGKVGRR